MDEIFYLRKLSDDELAKELIAKTAIAREAAVVAEACVLEMLRRGDA